MRKSLLLFDDYKNILITMHADDQEEAKPIIRFERMKGTNVNRE